MLSCVLALERTEGPTWSAREISGRDAEFSRELANNGEGGRLLRVVRHTRTELILHDDLVDEYPQCAPVVPNLCNPRVRIDMALPSKQVLTGASVASIVAYLQFRGAPALQVSRSPSISSAVSRMTCGSVTSPFLKAA